MPFTYMEPVDLGEALDALARFGDEARVIAGGTALVNLMKQRLVQPRYLIGLRHLPKLDEIQDDGGLRLGALCTHRQIETSPLVRRRAPLLAETFRQVATVRVRSMATLGGALAHADPNQDPPPALIVLDARVRLRAQGRQRELPVEQMFTGYYETALSPDEIVVEVVVPQQPAGSGSAFLKFLPQTRDDYATVAAAARVSLRDGRIVAPRVAVGAAAATPLRLLAVEEALEGEQPSPAILADAAALAADAVDPLTDFRGAAAYKRAMAAVFVRRALEQAAARAAEAAHAGSR
jgi:carbon-monoxide dehydrogenase medium subunit